MPNKTTQWNDSTAADVRTATHGVTETARTAATSMTDAAHDVAATVDGSRSTVAGGLDAAASALQDKAADLPGGETVRNVARATADRLGSSAEYVRAHDVKG